MKRSRWCPLNFSGWKVRRHDRDAWKQRARNIPLASADVRGGGRLRDKPKECLRRRLRIGSSICQSRVRLQTELDNTKSYYQVIIKITFSKKRRRLPSYERKVKLALIYGQSRRKLTLVDLNYKFECDCVSF